jgi:hypothetical protein
MNDVLAAAVETQPPGKGFSLLAVSPQPIHGSEQKG